MNNIKPEFTPEEIAERAKENSEFVSDVEQDTEIMEKYGLLDGGDSPVIHRPHRTN